MSVCFPPVVDAATLPDMTAEEAAALHKEANFVLGVAREEGWTGEDTTVVLVWEALRAAVTVERLRSEVGRLRQEMQSMVWVDPYFGLQS